MKGREAIQRDCIRRVSRWSAVVMAAAAVAQGWGVGGGVAPAKEDTKLPLSSFSAWVRGAAGEMAAAAVGMFAACGGGGT